MLENDDGLPESGRRSVDLEEKKGPYNTSYSKQPSEEDTCINESSDSGAQDAPSSDGSPSTDSPTEEEDQQQFEGSTRGQKLSRSKAVLITGALCVSLLASESWKWLVCLQVRSFPPFLLLLIW